MIIKSYISSGSFADKPIKAIFCENFDTEKDPRTLHNFFSDHKELDKLYSLGNIKTLGSWNTQEEVLKSTKLLEEKSVANICDSVSELVWRIQQKKQCDNIRYFFDRTEKNNVWFDFTPSIIKWFQRTGPKEDWNLPMKTIS